MKTDSQIQSDVIQELKWDPSVSHEQIGVAVSDAIVTLSGTIPSYIEKFAAEKAAQRVFGVKAVVEKIEVKLPGSYQRGDLDIAKAVVEQFKWSSQVPDELIKVKVEDGWVHLSGEVEWEYQRAAAKNLAQGLIGVKGVSNNIIIKVKSVQPNIVKQKIEDALKRKAEREARAISVEVNGGRVVLSGTVHSFSEVQDAKGAAWNAPGVTSVETHMNIVGY